MTDTALPLATKLVLQWRRKRRFSQNQSRNFMPRLIQLIQTNSCSIPRVKEFHMELNPHMTVEFAIKHFNKKWNVTSFAMNAALTWADLERFLDEGCDLNKVIGDLFEHRVELAYGYLKNPNITVKEFCDLRKWLLYDGLKDGVILLELSKNTFAWHPVIYRRRLNAAVRDRRGPALLRPPLKLNIFLF